MDISYTKGNKHPEDRIICVTTTNREWFSIYKLALLINQLSINENIIHKEIINNKGYNLLTAAINEVLLMSDNNIDWAEEKNTQKVMAWCKKHHLKFEKIEQELKRIQQQKLEGYNNGV